MYNAVDMLYHGSILVHRNIFFLTGLVQFFLNHACSFAYCCQIRYTNSSGRRDTTKIVEILWYNLRASKFISLPKQNKRYGTLKIYLNQRNKSIGNTGINWSILDRAPAFKNS